MHRLLSTKIARGRHAKKNDHLVFTEFLQKLKRRQQPIPKQAFLCQLPNWLCLHCDQDSVITWNILILFFKLFWTWVWGTGQKKRKIHKSLECLISHGGQRQMYTVWPNILTHFGQTTSLRVFANEWSSFFTGQISRFFLLCIQLDCIYNGELWPAKKQDFQASFFVFPYFCPIFYKFFIGLLICVRKRKLHAMPCERRELHLRVVYQDFVCSSRILVIVSTRLDTVGFLATPLNFKPACSILRPVLRPRATTCKTTPRS